MIEKIINVFKEACAVEENITLESELKNLSIDSITFVEVMVDIEEEFDIEFDIEDLNLFKWETVGDVVNILEEKVNAKK